MTLGLALRLTLYAQFVFGLGMRFGWRPFGPGTQHLHLGLAVVVVALAVLAIPRGPGPRQALRRVASFFPVLTFVIGLALFLRPVLRPVLVDLHALLGIGTVALAEMALSRRARPAGAPPSAVP